MKPIGLDHLRDGGRVFVDANIILYALGAASSQCRDLLVRCESGAIEGWITTSVVAEVAHRRMIQEAQSLGLAASNPARALAGKPATIRQLGRYAEDVRDLLEGGLNIDPVARDDFGRALEFQRQFGVMTNDSLNLAAARRLGIRDIATADRGFDFVRGFAVHKPNDLAS